MNRAIPTIPLGGILVRIEIEIPRNSENSETTIEIIHILRVEVDNLIEIAPGRTINA